MSKTTDLTPNPALVAVRGFDYQPATEPKAIDLTPACGLEVFRARFYSHINEPKGLEQAARDGCGCPPLVLCCAHFDNAILFVGKSHEPHCGRNAAAGIWAVAITSGFRPCSGGCGRFLAVAKSRDYVEYLSSKDDAIAAFHAAEARLLGRAE